MKRPEEAGRRASAYSQYQEWQVLDKWGSDVIECAWLAGWDAAYKTYVTDPAKQVEQERLHANPDDPTWSPEDDGTLGSPVRLHIGGQPIPFSGADHRECLDSGIQAGDDPDGD